MTEGAKVPGLCPQGTQAIPPPGKGREVAGPGVGMLAQATGWGRGGGFAGLDIQNCLPATPGLLAASKKKSPKMLLSSHGGCRHGERTRVNNSSGSRDDAVCLPRAHSAGYRAKCLTRMILCPFYRGAHGGSELSGLLVRGRMGLDLSPRGPALNHWPS